MTLLFAARHLLGEAGPYLCSDNSADLGLEGVDLATL